MSTSPRRFFGGLPHASGLAWELSHELRKSDHNGPGILLPDRAWALALRDECKVFLPEWKIHILSPLETDLLRNRGPSLLRRCERIRFFSRLFAPRVESLREAFFFTAEAWAQRSPSAVFWRENTLKLQTGRAVSRNDLSQRFAELGYQGAELVERECEFTVRGSIIDVFSPLFDFPLRLELYGEELQSIRLFHPDSQRTLEELQEAEIPPCHEFLFPTDDAVLATTRSRIRGELERLDIEKDVKDALLSRLSQRSFFPTIDYWAPQLDPEAYKSDDLAEAAIQFTVDAGQIEGSLRSAHKSIESQLLSGRLDGEWVPDPTHFQPTLESGVSWLRQRLDRSSWLSLKKISALANEPEISVSSDLRSNEALSHKLNVARGESPELPLASFAEELRDLHARDFATVLVGASTSQLERLHFLLASYHISFKIHSSIEEIFKSRPAVSAIVGDISQGFTDPKQRFCFILDEEILGTSRKRRHPRKSSDAWNSDSLMRGDLALLDLKPGDLVVHSEHGIGRYLGLKALHFQGVPSELLEIEYRDASKLLVPVTRLNLVQKYSSTGGTDAALDRMGGNSWETKKSRVKKELRSIAGELLHLYTEREMARAPSIDPGEKAIDEFAAAFPFPETPDQIKTIEACLHDLRGPRPMDRLVCGDVGYGKTEISMRAAHATVAAGYQVALLVPTTLLATQHASNFSKRFKAFGYRVEVLSRFRSTKEVRAILTDVKNHKVDILIGTHRLLGNDIVFSKLGLLVVDEEQKFGVIHKEKIKKMRSNVHILSMTATPIPRTLNMAMSGIKELSIITTPPQDRMSVRTHVSRRKEALIQDAIRNELKRGGQVFFVHNRVQTIGKIYEELQKLVPEASIEFVHGQMEEGPLEERMMNFYEGRTQILVTTSIIESGLDVSNANTLIVDRADTFGLGQLYQMRGRVGRSNVRAYAYFLIPDKEAITQDAEERLAVLESYQELGSGFHIASHDLEIRGAGDLLGREQSGQIAAIGFDAYAELLQECVAEVKGESLEDPIDPEISLGIDTTLPESYIPEIGIRLLFYRKLASAANEEEVEMIEKEMVDRFGSLPSSVTHLVAVMLIKCQLRRLGVKSLNGGKNGFSLVFDARTPVNPLKLVESVKKYPMHFQMSPEGKLFLKKPTGPQDGKDILRGVEGALAQLESWCT